MEIKALDLPGCCVIKPRVHSDSRGRFIKLFQRSVFAKAGFDIGSDDEWLTSNSKARVIRGLHFQTPPSGQGKLVYCLAGEVVDYGVDLRRNSPAYGRHVKVELSSEDPVGVYWPVGIAHGFAAITDATVAYLASGEYDGGADGGIRWSSAGIDWPFDDPILSERDLALPGLEDFASPFELER